MLAPFLMTFLISCSILAVPAKQPVDITVPETLNKTRMLQLVNDARKKGCNCGDKWYGPAKALTWNTLLEKTAYDHSRDMEKHKSLSHTSSAGEGPGDRIRKDGYKWTTYGENIAAGYNDEASVVAGWLSSPGHCSNLMNPSYKEMGVARSGRYWAQEFGAR